MKHEIGGYLELNRYNRSLYHKEAIALNTAANALEYLIKTRNIKSIYLPYFLCSSVSEKCKKNNVKVKYYHINNDFLFDEIKLKNHEWLYIVNYYGLIDNTKIKELKNKYNRIIVDNVQAYFIKPIKGVDTLYSCRKWFGVSDGAFLYTDKKLKSELELDKSFNRFTHILGRFENGSNEYYRYYRLNEETLRDIPLRKMSLLTSNILKSIDYKDAIKKREENFNYLNKELKGFNLLKMKNIKGPFAYPLYLTTGGVDVRKQLQEKGIFVPTLWADAYDVCSNDCLEIKLVENILPIPVDQRYNLKDMEYICKEIRKCIG